MRLTDSYVSELFRNRVFVAIVTPTSNRSIPPQRTRMIVARGDGRSVAQMRRVSANAVIEAPASHGAFM
jgi:hypothetical protein